MSRVRKCYRNEKAIYYIDISRYSIQQTSWNLCVTPREIQRVACSEGPAAPRSSQLIKTFAIQSLLSPPVYKKRWFLSHRPRLVLCHASDELLEKRKAPDALGPFLQGEEYGLVVALRCIFARTHKVSMVRPMKGDHTELSCEGTGRSGKRRLQMSAI